ncbi:uncharacterized protein LOC107987288 [Homo sapiens]|uniref:uncharacterized protein LOC107987288 n=1 Tax=Homo sapiens TaxID=9606 RepID=UPI001FB0B807|nr:uncharacterized protein LOC107987288 [Homo sapiens]
MRPHPLTQQDEPQEREVGEGSLASLYIQRPTPPALPYAIRRVGRSQSLGPGSRREGAEGTCCGCFLGVETRPEAPRDESLATAGTLEYRWIPHAERVPGRPQTWTVSKAWAPAPGNCPVWGPEGDPTALWPRTREGKLHPTRTTATDRGQPTSLEPGLFPPTGGIAGVCAGVRPRPPQDLAVHSTHQGQLQPPPASSAGPSRSLTHCCNLPATLGANPTPGSHKRLLDPKPPGRVVLSGVASPKPWPAPNPLHHPSRARGAVVL